MFFAATHRDLVIACTSPRAWNLRPRPTCRCHLDRIGSHWIVSAKRPIPGRKVRLLQTVIWHCPACRVALEVALAVPCQIAVYPFDRKEVRGCP